MSKLNSKLKPCPFCGGQAEIFTEGTPKVAMLISCTNCGCQLESGDMSHFPSELWCWNNRYTEDNDCKALRLHIEEIQQIRQVPFEQGDMDWLKRVINPDKDHPYDNLLSHGRAERIINHIEELEHRYKQDNETRVYRGIKC